MSIRSAEEEVSRESVLRHLPVFPAVALKLIKMIDEGGANASTIARLLAQDPALSAEILRHANSARYTRRGGVGDLAAALAVLGTDETCRVALGCACRGLLGPALGRPELRSCWEHCLSSAILAAALSSQFDQLESEAYTAGLLHSIGTLALVGVAPERYLEAVEPVRNEGMELHEAERLRLGVDHCLVGNWIVEEWRLPDWLCEIVRRHHDGGPFEKSMLSLVRAACSLSTILRPCPWVVSPWPGVDELLAELPLEDPALARVRIEAAAARLDSELR